MIYDSLIRYHLNLDPDTFSDDKWAEVYSGLLWVLKEQKNKQ